jgi:hypothetical protein
MVEKLVRFLFCFLVLVGHAHGQDSVFFSNSTDSRLMVNIEKLGNLDNGFEVFSWEWSETARDRDPRYGAAEVDGGFLSIGFIAQQVAKVYPDAVEVGGSGYLHINETKLAKADQYIRWKLTSDSRTLGGRCSRINGSRYTLCF